MSKSLITVEYKQNVVYDLSDSVIANDLFIRNAQGHLAPIKVKTRNIEEVSYDLHKAVASYLPNFGVFCKKFLNTGNMEHRGAFL